jgi:hypothetical protein
VARDDGVAAQPVGGAQLEHSAFGLTEFGCVHVADCGANLGIADACEVGEPDVLAEFLRGAL